jgi:hypothetical protein
MLRERNDDVLGRLLLERPDLAFPEPTSLSDVASRATTRHSVTDALSRLNAFENWVATIASGMSAPFAVADLPTDDADPETVRDAVVRLVDLGLLWGDPVGLTALRAVRAMTAMLEEVVPGPPPSTSPPDVPYTVRSASLVEKAAAGSAFEFVRRMDVLLEHCDHRPPPLRRDGHLSARELRGFAALLDASSGTTTTLFELATLSGLLGAGSKGSHEVLVPTRAFDDWQALPLADQWAVVIETWYDRHSSSGEPWLKRLVIEAFGDPAEGRVVSTDDVRRWVAWHRPRRPTRTDRAVSTMLDQAAWLGVTGLGAVAGFAATVDVRRLGELLPPRVDHVLIQADLTAVAPGPLTSDASHDLGLLADVESRGGATVYRISPESLARAYALGWSAQEVLATLQKRSSTPLPQALEYLVNDLERTGPRRTDTAGAHRDPQRGAAIGFDELSAADRIDPALAVKLVSALRAVGENPRGSSIAANGSGGDGGDPLFDSPLATLREAVESGEVVWVGFVDPMGQRSERLVLADVLDDGLLRARDSRSDEAFAVAVHRITAAHIIRTGRP